MIRPGDDALLPTRGLAPGQRTEVWVADVTNRATERVYVDSELLLEAPNWAPDGNGLLLNGAGLLWRLALTDQASLKQITIDGMPPINNDHVVDASRGLIYLSANDGHLYRAPLTGGTATRISQQDTTHHFLHGINPDGTELAFVALPRSMPRAEPDDVPDDQESAPGRLALMSSAGGPTRYPESGSRHLDGPEYSPDGAWIYLNTEEFGSCPGHAQVARVAAGGGVLERLVSSETVDWFPHLSPDDDHAVYLSYPPGTTGHPPDLPVQLRVVRVTDWSSPVWTLPVFGGQGTINVNSWSPDGSRFAFVAYPMAGSREAEVARAARA